MEFPSKLIEDAVQAFASLPGVGKKTALRLVMHLVQSESQKTENFSGALLRMRQDIKFCAQCHNVSDLEVCSICSNPRRDHSILCVVENFRDVLAIEQTQQYRGVYHLLGGLVSPIDGVGPEKLNIPSLLQRVEKGEVKEVIMALNPTLDGDTTIFYLSRLLTKFEIKITAIARGVAFGGELEYVDDITLARSLASRLPYENYFNGR